MDFYFYLLLEKLFLDSSAGSSLDTGLLYCPK